MTTAHGESLRLASFIWPDQPGGEDRLLAHCHLHGAAVDWLA
ncbi:MAG TPA: hypothetical protein VK439_15520 [Rubrivivax sp.]|nr:hypothetical protein [Rubrivivax sp.]